MKFTDENFAHCIDSQKLPFANECDLSRQPADQNQIFGMQSNLSGLMQQNNLAGPSDQIDPEIELVSDDGKVEVIALLTLFVFLENVSDSVVSNDQNMVFKIWILLKRNFFDSNGWGCNDFKF